MAIKIQGFCTIGSLISNNSNEIAALGELSTKGLSQTRDQKMYSFDESPGLDLYIFTSLRGVDAVDPDPDHPRTIINLVKKMRGSIDLTLDITDQIEALDDDISDVEVGNAITYGGEVLPAWVEFTVSINSEDVTTRLWLSDSHFVNEFVGFEIVVVPPIEVISNSAVGYTAAKLEFDAMSYPMMVSRQEEATGGVPSTSVSAYTLKWHDPTDFTLQFDTHWTLIGWGREANLPENQIQAIRNYLEANGALSVKEWQRYYPDLIAVDTLTFVPMWNRRALSSGESPEGFVFSPVFPYRQMLDACTDIVEGIDPNDVAPYLDVTCLLPNSIAVAIMGAASNTEGKRTMSELYPDFYLMLTNDPNSSRVSEVTLAAVKAVNLLFAQALLDTGTNPLPTGMVRNSISSVTFLELTTNGILFRMVTRESYTSHRTVVV